MHKITFIRTTKLFENQLKPERKCGTGECHFLCFLKNCFGSPMAAYKNSLWKNISIL